MGSCAKGYALRFKDITGDRYLADLLRRCGDPSPSAICQEHIQQSAILKPVLGRPIRQFAGGALDFSASWRRCLPDIRILCFMMTGISGTDEDIDDTINKASPFAGGPGRVNY